MRSLACVVLFLAACGGGSKSSTTTPPPGNTDVGGGGGDRPCMRSADHLVGLMTAVAKDAPPEKIKGFKDSFVGHCEADKWSPAMTSCVLESKVPDDLAKCESLLTPEQAEALAKEDQQPAAAPPPPPPGDGKSRGPTGKGKKTGDPCEGGE